MKFLRSLLFNIFYISTTLFFSTVGCLMIILPQKVRCYNARLWGKSLLLGLRVLVGIKCKVKGKENLPADGRYIVASKHQSALETIAFHAILPLPAYILKKELIYIPFFGWNLLLTGCIAIDRSSGAKALRSIFSGTEKRLKENRPVIIFPEGTRTAPGATTKYNPGIGLLYEKCGVPVIPTALNSGYFWRKKAFMKQPGTITIEFLPAMPEGLSKREFLEQLQNRIETACKEITPENIS